MGDDDKPFVCTFIGCGMSFTNEDRLTIHTSKHEMSLALSGGTSGKSINSMLFPADQTPTPTKFIKYSEEMGLFQELNTRNPFEESFKKAIGEDGSVMLPGPTSDLVETPMIPQTFEDEMAPNSDRQSMALSTDEGMKLRTEILGIDHEVEEVNVMATGLMPATHDGIEINLNKVVLASPASTCSSRDATPVLTPQVLLPGQAMQVLLQFPGGHSVPVQIPTVINTVTPAPMVTAAMLRPISITKATAAQPTVTSSSSLAKKKLKEVLTQGHSSQSQNSLPGSIQMLTETIGAATSQQMQAVLPNASYTMTQSVSADSTSAKKRHCSSTEDDPDESQDERRRKFLERNRAAAARCRNKKKGWVHQLEKKAEDLQLTNSKLQVEVTSLKNEVANLKSLLLTHKDCTVTKQQEEEGKFQMRHREWKEFGKKMFVPPPS